MMQLLMYAYTCTANYDCAIVLVVKFIVVGKVELLRHVGLRVKKYKMNVYSVAPDG